MPLPFRRCIKHGLVNHYPVYKCSLCAAENSGTQPTDVQQLKPKMPSYTEFEIYCEQIGVSYVQATNLFRYFALRFGR
jgi:hypothetical protein